MKIKLVSLNKDFDITKVVSNHIPLIEKTGKFSDEGVFSERIFGRLPSSGREYSCDCKLFEGRFYEGILCKECHTPVTCRDTVFSKKGWIDLVDYNIINPLFFQYFKKIIGNVQFLKIISQKKVLTVNGLIKEIQKVGPYDNIGFLEFQQCWEEILDYYTHKKRNFPKIIELTNTIKENSEFIFTSKIPIYNHILRPVMMVDKQMIFDEVNNYYNLLINNSNILKNCIEEERTITNINSILYRIQERANEIFDHVLFILSGKGGYLRGDLLGVRINFSARCVITPLPPGYEQNQVVIPYLTFLELFRFQLINLLSRIHSISLVKANEIWYKAQTKFDQTVYHAMTELINRTNGDREGIPALLNRNPTLSFGGILQVRIVGVKEDYKDYTMSIHNGILKLLAADFDGDVLCIIPLLDKTFADSFEIYDPRQMLVSRDGPKLNRAMVLDKDHVLGISILTEDL
jgi:DNA-directed RNA polymerase beta' subunit